MTRDEIYELLTKRLKPIADQLTISWRTDLDGALWALAQELAEKSVAQSAG